MAKTMNFEQAIKQLENIVSDLENGELTLDESIEKFESGIKLSKMCSKKLDDAERKISILVEKNGEFSEMPFEEVEE